MMAETDFQQEAQHISEFENYLENSGMNRVATCPFVYKHLTTKRYEGGRVVGHNAKYKGS